MDLIKYYKSWNLDDWSMSKEMFLHILFTVPHGSTILELGSGATTGLLLNFYKVISIEDDTKYLNRTTAKYIHAPLQEDLWYDVEKVRDGLEGLEYSAIIVDGPAHRYGFLKNKELFNLDVPIFFDDIQEENALKLFMDTTNYLSDRKSQIYQCEVNPKVVHWFDGKKYGHIFR